MDANERSRTLKGYGFRPGRSQHDALDAADSRSAAFLDAVGTTPLKPVGAFLSLWWNARDGFPEFADTGSRSGCVRSPRVGMADCCPLAPPGVIGAFSRGPTRAVLPSLASPGAVAPPCGGRPALKRTHERTIHGTSRHYVASARASSRHNAALSPFFGFDRDPLATLRRLQDDVDVGPGGALARVALPAGGEHGKPHRERLNRSLIGKFLNALVHEPR